MLLQLVHDFAILSKVVLNFCKLRWELDKQVCATNVWTWTTKEKVKKETKEASQACFNLKRAFNEKGLLEGELIFKRALVDLQQNMVIKLERRLEVAQLEVEEAKEEIKVRVIVEKLMAIYEAKLQAIEAYNASKEFKEEIVDGSTLAFLMGFNLFKA